MGAANERRKYTRVPLQRLLKCEKYAIPRPDESERQELKTKNVSGSGLLFLSKQKFQVGDLLRLELDLAGWEKYKSEFYKPDLTASGKPLVVLANVARVVAQKDGGYEIGVLFSGLDDGHKMALVKFLRAQQ
ncbi:MAG TPA: PilZ domain-containing protein [Elusimicrobiales bacterium]|nr:PilZ domain-containing protein [Elusimicrobiales bacterium]